MGEYLGLHVKKFIIKNKTSIIVLVLLIVFYLRKVPFEYEINKNITALQVNGKDKAKKEVYITVKGTYSTYIFGEDNFYGNIMINGFETTNESYKVNINIASDKLEDLKYTKFNGPRTETNRFGLIYVDNNFNSLAIIPFKEYLTNPSYAGSGGSIDMDEDLITVICYPETSRNNVMKLVNEMAGSAINN